MSRRKKNKKQSEPKYCNYCDITYTTENCNECYIDEDDENEYYNYHFERAPSPALEAAIEKNEQLIDSLEENRDNFADIGTNKAKRRLNKLAKTDPVAAAIRQALEIEDINICAKKYRGKYKTAAYEKKTRLLKDLSELFKKHNWTYGVQKTLDFSSSHVIYFEIPGCEQLSWHFSPKPSDSYPVYPKSWDGKKNSTLIKLAKITKEILANNKLL